MSDNNKKNISYYDTEYPHEFPTGKYFESRYNDMCSFGDSRDVYNSTLRQTIKDLGYKLIWNHKRCVKSEIITHSEYYEKDSILVGIKIRQNYRNKKAYDPDYGEYFEEASSSDSENLTIVGVYYINNEDFYELIEAAKKDVVSEKNNSKISLLYSTRSGLDTTKQDIKPVEIDIDLNYGEKFRPVHDKIVSKLNSDNEKGLVLLHGVPGTGKTNYIRYLTSLIDKEIIFLPPFLAENIASPEFITFLLDHTNSILIIEDAEKIVLDRDSEISNRQSVANLLNMTDGILSDCLSIQIIATFNTSRDKIDKALLRKGRLIAEWKFDSLSIENSKKIFESIGRKDVVVKAPMTLSEIYNYDEELNVVSNERQYIGFGR